MHSSGPDAVKVALPENMAAPTHKREPELAGTPNSSSAQGNPPSTEAPPRKARISVRMWALPTDPVASPWESEGPQASLIVDLIAASGGVVASKKAGVLDADFLSIPLATLAARRLQWAVQGFIEAAVPQASKIAILVHSPKDAPAETAAVRSPGPLEKADPGQILLSEEARQAIENLPGFRVLAIPGDGLRELVWRDPENQSTRTSDEETLTRILEGLGVPEPPAQMPGTPTLPIIVPASGDGAEKRDRPESESVRGGSRWVLGGVALAVVAAAAAGLYFYVGRPSSAPKENPAQTQTANPPAKGTHAPAPHARPSASGGPAHPAAPESTDSASKTAKNAPKDEVKPPETASPEKQPAAQPIPQAPVQRGNCDLDASQYSGQVDQAWKNLGRGKYADAQRQFSAVLACDPNNASARQGLERAKFAASQAQGQPQN